MGADFIQYIMTDKIVTPLDYVKEGYSEKIIWLPYSYFMTDYSQSCTYVLD